MLNKVYYMFEFLIVKVFKFFKYINVLYHNIFFEFRRAIVRNNFFIPYFTYQFIKLLTLNKKEHL